MKKMFLFLGIIGIVIMEMWGVTFKADAALNERKTVYVNSVEEFNAALASDTEIILSAGKYNFGQSPVEIIGLSNIEIRGTDMTQVVVETGDECIFYVESSDHICFNNLTIGHELQDYQNSFCPAAVMAIFNSSYINIDFCDIYGCGNMGFVASQSQNLYVFATTIRDCSKSIAQLNESDASFTVCTFSGNGYYQYPSNYAFGTLTYTKDKSVDIICRYCNFIDNKNPELIDLSGKYYTVNALFEGCRYDNNSFSEFNNYEADPNLIVDSYYMKNGLITIDYFSFNFTSEEIAVSDNFAGYPIIAIADDACFSDYVKKITLPEGLTKIGKHAFECASLKEIYIPSSVTSIEESALPSNNNISIYSKEESYAQTYARENGFLFNKNSEDVSDLFTYTIKNGEVTINNCKKDASGDVIIPSEIEGYPVTAIGLMKYDPAFYGCSKITSIYIPNSVYSILNSGLGGRFNGCSELKEIYVSKDNATFSSENGIIYSKDKKCLIACLPARAVGEFTIPGSVTEIGEEAFCGCNLLKNVSIPSSVTIIGDAAFYGCTSLEEASIPGSVKNTPFYVFENCYSLKKATISYGINEIGDSTFKNCSALTEVEIADSVEIIDDDVFCNCQSLTSIHLPKSLKSIGSVKIPCYAFSGCNSLKEYTIDEDCERFSVKDGVLYNKNMTGIISVSPGKEELYIPASVEEYLPGDFDNMYNQHITYPIQEAVSLKKIDVDEDNSNLASDGIALYSKDMSTIISYPHGRKGSYKISDKTTTIGAAAFTYSENIAELFIPKTVTEAEIAYGHYYGLALCPKLNICGYSGSFIETVAQKEKIPFTPLQAMAEVVGVEKTEKGYEVDLKIDNDSSQNLQNCGVMAAAYTDEQNNDITGFSSKGFRVNNGETVLKTIEVDANKKAVKKIKIYFWDSMNSMKPYSAPYEVYIEE